MNVNTSGDIIMKHFILVAIAIVSLAGCAQDRPNESFGTILGGAIGGIAGHQVGSGSGRVAATIVGTLIGGAIGGNVGRTMDQVDRQRVATTLERTPDNHSVYWQNPNSGAEYATTPIRTYTNRAGSPCREFQQTAYVGGKRQNVYGTACRQADGSWKIQ